MQLCKTGDQPYSDASPNGECSLPPGYLLSMHCFLGIFDQAFKGPFRPK